MSVQSVLQRVVALEQTLTNPAALLAASARTGGTVAPAAALETAAEPAAASGAYTFADALQSASASYEGAPTPASTAPPSTAGYTSTASSYLGAPSSAALPAPTLDAANTSALGLAYQAPSTVGAAALTPALGVPATSGGVGQAIVAIAESQAGQTEQPPGSNESPAIAQYRTATAGATPGAPWCAYFASWAAHQAGEPLGALGEGLGSAAQIWSWAQSTGRAVPNGPGVVPQPGDLIVFGDEHVGIVKGVLPDGEIQTIEGNYENKVALNVRTPTEATGYVRMS